MSASVFEPADPADLTIDDAPADAVTAGAIRRALVEWLTATPVDEYIRGDITLAVYEAVANVVQHAYRHTDTVGTVSVRASYTPIERILAVAVLDHGSWIPVTPNPRRGYGLPLIRTLATDTVVDRTDIGTSVVMHWAIT